MEVAAWDLMLEWTRQGHEVIGVTTPGADGLADAPFEVEVLPGLPARYSPQWFEATVPFAHRIGADVSFGVSAGAHAIVKDPVRGSVTVMQAHGTSIEEARSALSRRSARAVKHALGQIPGMLRDWDRYPRYDALVAVGPGIPRAIGLYPPRVRPRRTELIENGISLPAPRPVELPATSGPFAVFVGRLSHDKGPDLAVAALRHWHGDLVVVGDGPFEGELRRGIGEAGLGDRVHLLGRRDRSEIAWLLAAADAVVAPSRRREGLPLVALEALAAGTPLVTSSSVADTFGAVPPAGLLVSGPDAAEIGAQLHRAGSPDTAGSVALPDAYRLEVSAARYLRLFDELLGARAGGGTGRTP